MDSHMEVAVGDLGRESVGRGQRTSTPVSMKPPQRSNLRIEAKQPYARLPMIKRFVIEKSALLADIITIILIAVFAIFTVCAIVNLFATIVRAFQAPDHFVLGFAMHHDVLSSFFYVLIGEELLHSTLLHFDQNRHYASGMIAVAITAVCRKIIIIDYNEVSWQKLLIMGCMVLSLGFCVWTIYTKR